MRIWDERGWGMGKVERLLGIRHLSHGDVRSLSTNKPLRSAKERTTSLRLPQSHGKNLHDVGNTLFWLTKYACSSEVVVCSYPYFFTKVGNRERTSLYSFSSLPEPTTSEDIQGKKNEPGNHMLSRVDHARISRRRHTPTSQAKVGRARAILTLRIHAEQA